MSRSNPIESGSNPCTRWFEWAGGSDGGHVRYYDKQTGTNVIVESPFTFLLLDELSTVKGWHDASESGIFANEVRDTRQDVLVVKAFKGGELASGLYTNIRDRIGNVGGYFVSSCYIAYKDGDAYHLGNLAIKRAALNAWVEFKKSCGRKDGRPAYYVDAIKILGFDEGKKGKVVYRMPNFSLAPVSEVANAEAYRIDAGLQEYLAGYLSRPCVEQVQIPAEPDATAAIRGRRQESVPDFPDDDIPF